MGARPAIRRINRIYRWYPPRRWLFFPLYRFLRRKIRLGMAVSNMLVWTVSALLHAAVLAAFGGVVAGAVIGIVLFVLGVICTLVVALVKSPRTGRGAPVQ